VLVGGSGRARPAGLLDAGFCAPRVVGVQFDAEPVAAELLGVDQPTLRARMAEAEEAKAEEAGAAGGAPADDAWSDDDQAIPDVETEETSDAFEEAMEEVGA